jgi:hypothetical protein
VESRRLRYSTTDINDGRNSLGIYNTLSFIQEGRQPEGPEEEIRHRVQTQFHGLLAFARECADKALLLHEEVSQARQRQQRDLWPERHALRYDYFPDPDRPEVEIPVVNVETGELETRSFGHFEPRVRVKRSLAPPKAYVIGPERERLLEVLARHRIEMDTVREVTMAALQRIHIHNVTPMEEEEMTVPNADISVEEVVEQLPPGTVVISMNQPASLLLPLLLEPESTRGLLTESGGRDRHFGPWLEAGTTFPVLRATVPLKLADPDER